jgi:glycerate-2-kinase
MEPRILNWDMLASHGNIDGRKAALAILEAGLQASDPYNNTRKLLHLEGNILTVSSKEFEPKDDPRSGPEVIDLSKVRHIYVLGAAKGVQRVAKAIEDVLGDRLTGGHVIDKKGGPVILKKIGVTLGAHPVPDIDCVRGCEKILEITKTLTKDDLVFTCTGSGVSALLTMPVPGVTIEEVSQTTYMMQIERGAPTNDLNAIRNHLDVLKGGKMSRYIAPAKAIHIVADDPNTYQILMNTNSYLHNLPDNAAYTYEKAIENLKKWDAWDAVPESVRKFLLKADPAYATVKLPEFEKFPFRVFGVMPGYRKTGKFPAAIEKAKELGYKPVILAESLQAEAVHAGKYAAAIARAIEHIGQPIEPPCALFSSGEMIVTVGQETGIGGRNQEFTLSVAQNIAGSKNIVVASVDTDGTDGPGVQYQKGPEGMPDCLGGGLVDGYTLDEAKAAGVNIDAEIKRHNASPPLWKMGNGIHLSANISLLDFTIILVTKRA